jgi:hypothetical protein
LRATVAKAPPSSARRIRAPTQTSVDSSMGWILAQFRGGGR